MPAKSRGKQTIQLHHEDADNWVVVTPPDEDRTMMSVGKAILACNNLPVVETVIEFNEQFKALRSALGVWLAEHGATVETAYLTLRDAGLLFLVVRKDREYERDFEDELTKLDITVAQDPAFRLLRLSVLALPNVSLEAQAAFLSNELVIKYSAN